MGAGMRQSDKTAMVRGSALCLSLLIVGTNLASSEPVRVDTEHIFGFTEGADIGEKGEVELENTATGSLAARGRLAAVSNETAFRYGIEDGFRASLSALTDYQAVGGTGLRFGGLSSEFRWQPLERPNSPIGLTFSFAPQWQRIDPVSGQHIESYSFPLALLADTEIAPNQTFAAFNATYSPTLTRANGRSQTDHPLELSQAVATTIVEGIFVGAEVRHINRNQNGLFTGHALFVGPSLFVKLSEDVGFKIAWSAQLPDETTGRLDLVNFDRHQVLALIVKGF